MSPLKKKILQLSLWSLLDERKVNIIALYDLAPKFIYRDSGGDSYGDKIVEKTFMHGDRKFTIIIKPAIMKTQNGGIIHKFPSRREKMVELAIRRLSSQRDRILNINDNNIRFFFSIKEVKDELARINHPYGNKEIREAIVILNETKITITDDDTPRRNIFSSSIFPTVGLKGHDCDESTFVDFNPMIVESIKRINFQQIDYDIITSIKDNIGQWLIKKIYIDNIARSSSTYTTSYSEIIRDAELIIWNSKSNSISRINKTMALLKELGIFNNIDITKVVKKNNYIVNVFYELHLSDGFIKSIKKMKEVIGFNNGFYNRIAARNPKFIEISEADEALVNRRLRGEALSKKRLSAALQIGFAPLRAEENEAGIIDGSADPAHGLMSHKKNPRRI